MTLSLFIWIIQETRMDRRRNASEIILLLCVICMVSGQDVLIDYNILEELEPDTLIGNIPVDAKLDEKYDMSVLAILRYSFLSSGGDSLFSIEETTGIIRTASRIDRDLICPGLEICSLELEVGISPGIYFQIITIQIEILDINDNSPIFSESEVSHVISEVSPVDSTYIPLPIPEDVDSPTNGLHHYEIIPRTSIFAIEARESMDGSVDLQLVLREKLDREQTDFYQVRVFAYDSGAPARSGSVLVNITVEDANDNHPEFTQTEYAAQIPENLRPEATIITVTAHDDDITHNGRVVYGLSSRTQSSYGELFGIRENTGEVYLKSIVDAEKIGVYNLVVTATDQGPGSRAVQAMVVVHVQDMNDNKPEITVNTLTSDQQGQISEVSTIGTFVAHVSVKDQDKGDNGNVTCTLNDTNFDVQQMHTEQFKIITNNMFDREEQESYVVRITCMDHGSPALTSLHDLTVNVLDVNDQPPVFTQLVYRASVPENSVVDTPVLRVSAVDGDKGLNAAVRYSLEQLKPGYFKIAPESGEIQTAMGVDYEEVQLVELKVIATDEGQPQKTGTATVFVTIEDRNDEPPTFIQENYSFGIYENFPKHSEVGVVNAYDPDSEEFSLTEYKIKAADQYVIAAFTIDKKSGRITSKLRLDRESIPVYNLEVLAYNPGYDLTSTASVTIYVADENDHAPEVEFPNPTNNTVTISNLVPFGYVVTRIRAKDEDIGNNAQLVFALIQGNEEGLFDMDATTGAITVSSDLAMVPNRTYNLSVEVMDNGVKPQTIITMIHITIDSTIPYFTHGDQNQEDLDESGSNSMIVIIVGCISGAVIVALVVAILAIRMQDVRRKEDRRYNCRMEAQKMLHGGSQSPIHKNTSPANTMYNPSSKYSIAGNDIITRPQDGGHLGSPQPEGCSRTSSFLEKGSLNNIGNPEGRGGPSWTTQNNVQKQNCSSSETANQGPCQSSHGQQRPIREPQTLSSFSLPHTEIGHHHSYPGQDPYRHGDHTATSHGFPAHSAAINKPHLSPLAEDIQLQQAPWGGRVGVADHDNESACSGEMSNTDSGRGGSEEGEHGHGHHSNQPGNRLSDISDSDIQDKINKVGCHGNTRAVMDVKNNLNAVKSPNKPGVKALDVMCKKHPSGPQTTTSYPANIINGNPHRKIVAPNKSNVTGYVGTHTSLPGWENVPIGGRRKPPRPPRTDSLRKEPLNRSFISNTESQYGSTTELGDDASSTTSGSYVVDHDAIPMDNFASKPTNIRNVTVGASNV